MKTNPNTTLLVFCLLFFAIMVNSEKIKEKETKVSPSDIKSSPQLIQSKVNEKVKGKVAEKLGVKKQQPDASESDAPVTLEPNSNPPNQQPESQPSTSTTKYQQQPPGDENSHFFSAKDIVCSQENCIPPYGICTDNNTTCKCLEGYANFTPEGKESYGYYCSYPQKKQLVAFLLEFFISNGIGHFYSGRILFGVFKLLICIAPILISILMCCAVLSKDNTTCLGLFVTILSCGFLCAALVWQLADVIIFGINNYKDGNGVPLQHW